MTQAENVGNNEQKQSQSTLSDISQIYMLMCILKFAETV